MRDGCGPDACGDGMPVQNAMTMTLCNVMGSHSSYGCRRIGMALDQTLVGFVLRLGHPTYADNRNKAEEERRCASTRHSDHKVTPFPCTREILPVIAKALTTLRPACERSRS